MNIKLLKQVKAMILRFPDNTDMESWSNGTLVADKHSPPICGTTGCIAGWALALTHGAFNMECAPFLIDEAAARLLGLRTFGDLDEAQADSVHLFYLCRWPNDFRFSYEAATSPRERAQVVADRIDHFIATGGAE